MAIVKGFKVARIEEVSDRADNIHFSFLQVKEAPNYFKSYEEAEIWIREKANYQKTHSIIEVFLDDKYL